MATETFDFINARGRRLSGKIEAPEVAPRGWALLAHCFTRGKDSSAAVRVSRALARGGIGVLRFDFAGLGDSDGDFADATFSADVDDLLTAAHAMSEAGKFVSMLVGHSLGGAAAIVAASRIPGSLPWRRSVPLPTCGTSYNSSSQPRLIACLSTARPKST